MNMLKKMIRVILCCSVLFSLNAFAIPKLITFPTYNEIPLISLFTEEKVYEKIDKMAHDLGMENVPVLDQGSYGTCVTFATTAALDAVLKRGDFISQQGSLELDYALGDNWWNGAYTPMDILLPLQQHGVAAKKGYPRDYPRAFYRTTLAAYLKLIDSDASAEVKKVQYTYNKGSNLNFVREAINRNHRVLIGFIVDTTISGSIHGYDITINGQKKKGGLWACQQGNVANRCVKNNAGHEVVITGYDDEQQLLKIRNSWGTSVGDEGEYYMTYKYFELMVLDSTEIW